MADQETTVQDAPQVTAEIVTDNSFAAKLADSWFSDTPIKTETESKPQVAEATTDVQQPSQEITTQTAKEPEDEVFDENDYIKKKFGYDSAEVFEKEIKTLKEKSTQSFEWKNDQSKQIAESLNEGKIDELYNYLHTKKQLEKLTTADLTANKNLAAELVKFGIQKDNPTLTQDEVDFLFNQNYTLPEKPIQGDIEDEDEYKARLNTWQFQVNNIEKKLIIDAKIQQPKLAQFNNELVLPHIPKEAEQSQPKLSDEDIQRLRNDQSAFIENSSKSLTTLNDYSVNVKDKDVDYNVSYGYSKEEKDFVNSKLKDFVDSGFDANKLLVDLWVEPDGRTLKTETIVKDLLRLYAGDKLNQKLANDSANKRLEAYLAAKKNIDISGKQPQGTFNPEQPKSLQEAVTESWLKV